MIEKTKALSHSALCVEFYARMAGCAQSYRSYGAVVVFGCVMGLHGVSSIDDSGFGCYFIQALDDGK